MPSAKTAQHSKSGEPHLPVELNLWVKLVAFALVPQTDPAGHVTRELCFRMAPDRNVAGKLQIPSALLTQREESLAALLKNLHFEIGCVPAPCFSIGDYPLNAQKSAQAKYPKIDFIPEPVSETKTDKTNQSSHSTENKKPSITLYFLSLTRPNPPINAAPGYTWGSINRVKPYARLLTNGTRDLLKKYSLDWISEFDIRLVGDFVMPSSPWKRMLAEVITNKEHCALIPLLPDFYTSGDLYEAFEKLATHLNIVPPSRTNFHRQFIHDWQKNGQLDRMRTRNKKAD